MTLTATKSKALASTAADLLNVESVRIVWLAGDGSDRQYYRLVVEGGSDSFVLMLLSKEDGQKVKNGEYEWILASNLLRSSGICAPSLIAPMPQHNALIIDDYGDEMLQDSVNAALALGDHELPLRLYHDAIDLALSINGHRASFGQFWTKRSFDFDKYMWELQFFYDQYFDPVSKAGLDKGELELLHQDFQSLATFLSPLSKYCVHRDYHSRNLMVHQDCLAVIDFQDLRLGPIAYDIVSLVFDSYVHLPLSRRLDLVDFASKRIALRLGDEARREFDTSWKSVLLQRQIKAIGSFGYLTLEKQRGNYLKYVRPAVAVLRQIAPFDSRWPFISGRLLEVIEADAR